VSIADSGQQGLLSSAAIVNEWTAVLEGTPYGKRGGARCFPFENDALSAIVQIERRNR
jgi:hypothetical protein